MFKVTDYAALIHVQQCNQCISEISECDIFKSEMELYQWRMLFIYRQTTPLIYQQVETAQLYNKI